MDSTETTASGLASVEATLREQLARADAALSAAAPALGRLLGLEAGELISDEMVARVRGMLADLARQLIDAVEEAAGTSSLSRDSLAAALAEDEALLGHLHALAVEGRIAGKLEAEAGIDPVLSPLFEGLIAGGDEVLASATMGAVAAQASFIQQQRRMTLPLGELPAELLPATLGALRRTTGDNERADEIDAALRQQFDEGRSRIGLLTRLVMRTGSNAPGALDVASAGLAFFVTALALAAGQERGTMVMALAAPQPARLALALRAAGLPKSSVQAQCLYFHPDAMPADGLLGLRADQAAAMLVAAKSGGHS